MSLELRTKILYLALALVSSVSISSCKTGDESFNFAGEVNNNDQQGAAAITSFSPILATNIMCSSVNVRCGTSPFLTNGSSQSFSVSVTGAAPMTYEWKLNGTVISGATASLYTMNAGPAAIGPGTYTLTVTVANDLGGDTHSFAVKVNSPPAISTGTPPSPTNVETLGLNYASVKTLNIYGSDANSDTITYVWQLDGSNVARLSGSTISGGSQGSYSPSVGDMGAKTVKVILRDSHYAETGAGKYEPEEYSWVHNINYLSDKCNQLVAGAICTVVGRPGMATDTDAPVDGLYTAATEPVKVRPNYILDDGSGNLFISDSANHTIWFHNRSGGSVTRFGKTIAAGKIIALVGNGSGGISPDDNASYAYTNYKLNAPQMMYYDNAVGDEKLYIADFYNNRVVRINKLGLGATVFGNLTTTANNTTTNGSSAAEIAATTAVCQYPVGLVVNAAKTRMYVACSRTHLIKYVNMTNPNPFLWTSSVAAGRVSNTGAVTTSVLDNNVIGGADWLASPVTARVTYPWALALDQNENLYWIQNGGNSAYSGRIQMLKLAANPTSFFGGLVSTPTIGRVYTIVGGNGDTPSNLTNASAVASSMRDGRGLAILEPSAGNIDGFFVSSSLRSIILFFNNSNATQTFGNNSISTPAEAVTGNAGTDVIAHAGHTFVANEPVYFQTLTGGTGLVAGTTYFVRTIVPGVSYQLSASSGGGVFNFTSNITAAMIRRPDVGLIWGVYSALGGGYTGESASAANSNRLNNPTGLTLIGNDLLVADTNNFRVRKLDISSGNGSTSTVTGGIDTKTGSSADSETPAPDFRGYFFEQMIFNSAANKIYFADNGAAPTNWNTEELPRTPDIENHRIRRFDPVKGVVDTLVGRGWGDTSPLNEPANTALIQGVKGMALMPDGNILFADRHLFGAGANRSCMVRAYNSTASIKTYFSAIPNVLAGNVATLAGNYANGCNTFTGGGGAALSSRIYYPEGIATDGSNLYIASYQQHCILKVDSVGTINSYIGLCGTANDVNGAFGTARLRFPTQLMSDPRYPVNFFVVDQTDQIPSSIKYVNLTGANVDVVGSTVADQQIQPLTGLTSGGYTQAVTTYTPTPVSVTGSAATDVITHAGHTFQNNDAVDFHSLTGGTGLTADTRYYIKNVVDGVSYKLGASSGSSTTIDITTDVSAGSIALDSDLICYTSGALGNGGLGSHNVICRQRRSGNLSIRIGQADGGLVKGGSQLDAEEEGLVWNSGSSSLNVKLSGPAGLTFDSEGNLYITERDNAVIRKIKKWW